MKISLITICYNSEKTIASTFDSVLSQNYDNYEYIIIDGKSKDNTLKIINEYEKKFNGKMIYISEKDNGIYDAMNKGIKMASGDVVGILNSDDILFNERVFSKIYNCFLKDSIDGIYSNLLLMDDSFKAIKRNFRSGNVSHKLGWHPPHPTLYLRKKIYKKYGYFNEKYKVTADLDFMYRLINNSVNLKYIDDYFVKMRIGGASTNGIKGYYNNFIESIKVLKNNNRKFPLVINTYRFFNNLILQKIMVLNYRKTIQSEKQKLIQINTVCNGSTGRIMSDIQRAANNSGYETISFYGRRNGYSDLKCEKFGNFISFWLHVILTTVFDLQGYGSYFCTKRLVKRLKMENPDIIHLHNLHGYYINLPVLFNYLSHYSGKVFWTFHDCWPFTGHCSHFILAKCDKWKSLCYKCPNKGNYPISWVFDNSKRNYLNKIKYVNSLNNLTIITPSNWLENYVKQSFFQQFNIVTINNYVDLKLFKRQSSTALRLKYNIPNGKRVLLGVSNIWNIQKGLNEFINISKEISDDMIIILIGLTNKQKDKLKKYKNIFGIEKVNNSYEMAGFYSMADVLINPSKEETFSLVTLESIACNTPVIVYNNTPMVEFVNNNSGLICNKKISINDIRKSFGIDIENSYIKKYNIKNFQRKIIKLYGGK